MKEELEELETEKRQEVADKIHEAVAQGDISESFDYEEAKREQGFVEGRILKLKRKIRRAEVVEEEDLEGSDKVRVGSVVEIEIDGKETEYEIIGAGESDPLSGTLSYDSPLGRELLGRSEGDSFVFEAPRAEMEVKIRAIG